MAHLTITRWRTTETIIRTFKIPEGTVIVKHVTAMDSVPEAIQERQSYPHDRHYLIHQSCVYLLDYFEEAPGMDDHGQLTPEFRAGLLGGKIDPNLCFPLRQGQTWGNNSYSSWKVVGVQAARQPSSKRDRIFHISSSMADGLTSEVWLKRNVGTVRQQTICTSPYWQNASELVTSKRPGKSADWLV